MLQEELGKRIQELRKEKDLSQEKFALAIGMDRTYFASVEAFLKGKCGQSCRVGRGVEAAQKDGESKVMK